jgi:sodium/potassium-transporting ATPase subunit beta
MFYGVLAALFAMLMWVFFQTIDPKIPKLKLDASVIGTNPGLGFRPMPLDTESALIWYKGYNYESYKQWTDALTEFLAVHKTPESGQNAVDW